MASIQTVCEESRGLTIHTIEGVVTARELACTFEKQFRDGKITNKIIWDFREADFTNVSREDLQSLANLTKMYNDIHPGRKSAFIGSDDFLYGIGRMYQAFVEFKEVDYSLMIFRSMDEATAWLGV